MTTLSRALGIMGYDVGCLSRDEAGFLAGFGIAPPAWQRTAKDAPVTIVTTAAGDKVGFLRFPPLPPGADGPSEETMDRLSRAIGQLRRDVRLVVALSEWGWVGEQEYLSAEPKDLPDILLGSGNGSGVNGRILGSGRCLWVRAYDKGRSIAEISILKWPDRKNSFAWNPGTNYNTKSIGMNDLIKDNPAVDAVLR